MKVSVVLAGLVWPALAFGQQLYTNADLVKFQVPGAYVNEDLSRLSPLVVQKAPAAVLPPYVARPQVSPYQAQYDGIRATRELFACELDLELKRVAFSESGFAGDTREFAPRLGYRAHAAPIILELQKRIAILDFQMEDLVDEARLAGAPVSER